MGACCCSDKTGPQHDEINTSQARKISSKLFFHRILFYVPVFLALF